MRLVKTWLEKWKIQRKQSLNISHLRLGNDFALQCT